MFSVHSRLVENLATLLSSLSLPIYPPLFSGVLLWILICACNTFVISSRILWCHYLLESQFEYLPIERMAAMALAAFWLDGEEQDLQVPVEHSRTAVISAIVDTVKRAGSGLFLWTAKVPKQLHIVEYHHSFPKHQLSFHCVKHRPIV